MNQPELPEGTELRVVEFDGIRFVYHVRPEDKYTSFSKGVSWHDEMSIAYYTAKEAGLLTIEGQEDDENSDGYELFVVSFLKQLATLQDGERMVVVNHSGRILITRETIILAVRASDVTDIEYRVEGD